MGKHRFRFLDMMPNAWFYKLRDMNKPHPFTKKTPPAAAAAAAAAAPPPQTPNQNQALLPNRASYYFPSNSPLHPTHFLQRVQQLSSTTCRASSVSEPDSDDHSYCIHPPPPPSKDDISSVDDLDVVGSELVLRPILTKPAAAKAKAKTKTKTKPSSPAARIKARSSPPTVSSPVNRRRKARLQPRRAASSRTRRGIDESFAVVKSSSDPKRDFRESMVEMILENRLTSSKDLEHLLACYLLLNSNHYHDVIVNVFQEIWLDMVANFVTN